MAELMPAYMARRIISSLSLERPPANLRYADGFTKRNKAMVRRISSSLKGGMVSRGVPLMGCSRFSGMEDMEDVCEVLRVSIERCYSMSHFITNFADVVRIPEPQSRPQELNQVVSACKRFMETVCQNRNIEIVMDLSEESPVVNLDNSLFEQVLVNIIKNAAESIDRDGKIYIRTTVRPTCLEIADTGKGIDKETETKLFSPFFSTKPNGQGIGLIFIREVLLKHDCRFSLRSYADGLTRFKIWFS